MDPGAFETRASLDPSKAIKLKDPVFWCGRPRAGWIVTVLQVVESENLQEVTIQLTARLALAGRLNAENKRPYSICYNSGSYPYFSKLLLTCCLPYGPTTVE